MPDPTIKITKAELDKLQRLAAAGNLARSIYVVRTDDTTTLQAQMDGKTYTVNEAGVNVV